MRSKRKNHKNKTAVIELTSSGLYCRAGDFYLDPWQPVERALITHAHSDHAHYGSKRYLTHSASAAIIRQRLVEPNIETLDYGQSLSINGVQVSFHPAGHILGSAQIRLVYRGETWVFSGDYKTEPDPTCAAFEPVLCDTFISESTFALPVYRWPAQAQVFADIHEWWRSNQADGRASLLMAYSLGKAQRLLAGLDNSIGPIFVHGAVEKINAVYRAHGVALPHYRTPSEAGRQQDFKNALILAPPGSAMTLWARRFAPFSDAFASGWMRLRGTRKRLGVDRGFVLSDHADWPGLLSAIEASGASNILVTHGYARTLARHLREIGIAAEAIDTRFEGEQDAAGEIEEAP